VFKGKIWKEMYDSWIGVVCEVKKKGVLVVCSIWIGCVILQWSTREENGVDFDEDEEGEEDMVGAVRREG
jgi:hypothetical protein